MFDIESELIVAFDELKRVRKKNSKLKTQVQKDKKSKAKFVQDLANLQIKVDDFQRQLLDLEELKRENSRLKVKVQEDEKEMAKLIQDINNLKIKVEKARRVEEVMNEKLQDKEVECERLEGEIVSLRIEVKYSKFKFLQDQAELKSKVEEARKIEEDMVNQLKAKRLECEGLEHEVVSLKMQVKYSKDKLHGFVKSLNELDDIIKAQRSPFIKFGLGYEEGQSSQKGESSSKEKGIIEKEPMALCNEL